MTIKIKNISDLSNLGKERIIISVNKDTDIGNFVVLQSKVYENNPSASQQDAFWFPDQKVSAEDLVVLYSKMGKSSKRKQDDGSTIFFFYWGSDKSLWEKGIFTPVVIEIKIWQSIPREVEE